MEDTKGRIVLHRALDDRSGFRIAAAQKGNTFPLYHDAFEHMLRHVPKASLEMHKERLQMRLLVSVL